ncbi:MAG: LptF/LptG family permease [Saprospirales bacterium]|nr:LptF/LptG family permease [Saprospirales bacterium]
MIQIKKIDRLLIQGFIPPFIVTFFIALFVLVMQTLWLYIDEIAGKGVGFFLMMELLGYLSVSMIPLALPIAILISSVMVLGNLAERYELSSMKSAGVPLWRIMLPLMVLDFGIATGSFYVANNLIPISNLKFRSRLYDIRKQKPTLNLEEGIFNDDFEGFAIRIGNKGKDQRTIEDVLIINHSGEFEGRVMEIAAKSGEMYVTEDERYFVMQLYDGWQYQELDGKEDSYPFLRTHFEEWQKVFDLSEFQINRTDERLFKSHQSMLTVGQLLVAIDSIDLTIEDKMQSIRTNGERYFYFLQPADSTVVDSLKAKPRPFQRGPAPIDQASLDCLDTLSSIMYTFPEKRREEIFSRADTYARSVQGQVQSAAKSIQRKRESRVNHYFEMHSKFSFAVSCVIFLFIGAPMGAIVRKGGFGYPMIISILFFMAFIVLNIFSKNIAERFVIPPVQAAWLPAAVFFPMGLILTYLAMNDYHQTIDLSRFKRILEWFRKILRAVGVRF